MRTQYGVSEVSYHVAYSLKDMITSIITQRSLSGITIKPEAAKWLTKVIKLTLKTKGKILSILPYFCYYNDTIVYK